jgi:hypothetical protein
MSCHGERSDQRKPARLVYKRCSIEAFQEGKALAELKKVICAGREKFHCGSQLSKIKFLLVSNKSCRQSGLPLA